uniref:Putative conjugal transfer protein n=1 Tax=Caulobacter sp. (strain K31) TaxID=366602 RepID=B0T9B2_CAUSK
MFRPSWILLLALTPAPLAAAAIARPEPLLLINTSPSEPVGLYVATGQPARTGTRIAFRVPAPGRAYAARVLPERLRTSVLKTIAAGEGDHVCAGGAHLVINGRDVAPIAERDRRGQALPRWRQCRRLVRGEYFVFSARIPNSFDSRYYGPVQAGDVIGVYRPLKASGAAPDHPGGA